LTLQGIAWICVPAARESTATAAGLLIAQQVFGDAGGTVAIITGAVIPQMLVQGRLLGRVKATISFVAMAALIAGSIIAGLLAEVVGLRPVMYMAAISLAITGVVLALSSVWTVTAADAASAPLLPHKGD
jgi:MFS family permease